MTRKRFIPSTGEWVEVGHRELLGTFTPFESAQIARDDAKAIGAHFDEKDGVTTVRSERQLREYLAIERGRGRDMRWKEHAERPRRQG